MKLKAVEINARKAVQAHVLDTKHDHGTEFAKPARNGCWKVIATRSGIRLTQPVQCRSGAANGSLCCFVHRKHNAAALAFRAALEAAA